MKIKFNRDQKIKHVNPDYFFNLQNILVRLKFVAVLLLLQVSAKQEKITAEDIAEPNKTIEPPTSITFEDPYCVEPLAIDSNFRSLYSEFEIHKKLFSNPDYPGQVDTIIKLTSAVDTIEMYQAKTKMLLLDLAVHSSRIVLKNDIRIGMSKDEFYKKFHQIDTVRNRPDRINIWMTDSGIEFIFIADALAKITWTPGEIE